MTVQTASIVSAGEAFYVLTISPILKGISAGLGILLASTRYISGTVSKILVQVETLPEILDNVIKRQLDDFKEYLNEFPERSNSGNSTKRYEVSLQIVGESYYRWDSTSTYFPTLTFLFKEVEASQYKSTRRSQIKVRLNKRNEDLTNKNHGHKDFKNKM